jgi:hypothetical protein
MEIFLLMFYMCVPIHKYIRVACRRNGLLACISVTISVVSTPDVLGGTSRIEGTRVGVQQLGALIGGS